MTVAHFPLRQGGGNVSAKPRRLLMYRPCGVGDGDGEAVGEAIGLAVGDAVAEGDAVGEGDGAARSAGGRSRTMAATTASAMRVIASGAPRMLDPSPAADT